MNSILNAYVHEIVELLVARQYEQIARITHNVRLDSASIESAVRKYGRTLAMPPENAFELLDVVPVINARAPSWSVRMHLWTAEEGQSDLSIELTIAESGSGHIVELDDIHVL